VTGRSPSIAIVGAGLGGLTVAATLRLAGFDVRVYEQATRFGRIGAGIQMMPNSMKVLRRIGIEARVRATSFQPYSHLNRAWDTGEVLRELPMPESLFGAPYLCMHRADLVDALVSTVPEEIVELKKTLVGLDQRAGEVTLAFAFHGPILDQAIDERGDMPLPPYIASRRGVDARDREDYQTLFARQEGSVAAPTASLHFTPELMQRLQARGVFPHIVTLHVGAGTFLPVKVDDTESHVMHPECGTVSAETAEALNVARRGGGRIVAAGSTSLRLLESATDEDGIVHPFAGETSIFITPGYRFRAVDVMLTNFHLPRSTLFMLVSAFSGLEVMHRAYDHAIASGYRFYSYGDACLLFPAR
jgi:S-adenosylmethionine:tRNA ribosyltransferase-isomerase